MRLAHLSDLHFGHHHERLAAGLAADVTAQNPDLVVISGDFAQIGTETEFAAARVFLAALKTPVFAVPGNHDVPATNLLERFFDPYRQYRRYIAKELEPFLELGGVALAGLNTSRRIWLGLNWSHGAINQSQLDRLEKSFEKCAPEAVRVVVAHHPLMQPSAAMAEPMQLVKRADLALRTFSRIGVRLVLSGHFHMSYVRRHENEGEIKAGEPTGPRKAAGAPILVAQASSTISTRLRGDKNAYNLIDIDAGAITIRVREWLGDTWTTREKASESLIYAEAKAAKAS